MSKSVKIETQASKDVPLAFGLADMTAATAAVTLACLFTEMLCYVLGRLHSSYVLSTRIGLHRIELINKTLVNDDLKKKSIYFYVKSHKF